MRYNLVTSFRCGTCGSKLKLTYNKPKCTPYQPEASDGITGASKVEQCIYIEPCEFCMDKYKRPFDAMKNAIEAMK